MPSRRLRIAISDHNGASLPFARALHAAGHTLVDANADALLIDFDPPLVAYRATIDKHANEGAKVILYPHGAGGPNLSHDALWEPYGRVDASLVTGFGHAEFARRIEYPAAVHVVGWSHCELRPFRARGTVEHVVFAPFHPNADGSMADAMRELNRDVFEELRRGPWHMTVRHIGSLAENGLCPADGVTFVDGRTSPRFAEIDVADAVVGGDGTLPALAIARGVPTVMYGQGRIVLGIPGERPATPRRPERYMDYVRYPLDVADGPLDELLHAAARDDDAIADWRRRFMGGPLSRRTVVTAVEQIVEGEAAPRIDPTRQFTTVALASELVERPALLRDYVDRVGLEDNASLVISAPGLDADGLLELTEEAILRAGLDAEALPDTLLSPLPGSPASYAALAERADALLSDWPAAGPLGAIERFSALPTNV